MVFKQIRYKPNSASIEDGLRLENLDSERGGFVLCMFLKTNALICAFVVAYATCWVSHDATHMYLHLAVS